MIVTVILSTPVAANSQVLERLGNAAARAAEGEAHRQVDRTVRNAIRCAVGDRACQEKARKDGKEVILVDERGDPLDAGNSHWNLAFGGRRWNGDLAHVIEDDNVLALHLVGGDDVTFYLFLREEDEGGQDADAVFLAFGNGERCRYSFEDADPFPVWLDRSDGDWVTGSYDGAVRCEYRSAPTRASGTFRVAR